MRTYPHTHSKVVHWQALVLLATSLALASCANTTYQAPTAHAPAPTQLMQVGYGAAAGFVRCVLPKCPIRSPKTLGSLPIAHPTGPAAAPQPVPAPHAVTGVVDIQPRPMSQPP